MESARSGEARRLCCEPPRQARRVSATPPRARQLKNKARPVRARRKVGAGKAGMCVVAMQRKGVRISSMRQKVVSGSAGSIYVSRTQYAAREKSGDELPAGGTLPERRPVMSHTAFTVKKRHA